MNVWQQFFIIAGAHFLALLSPGPDFFLIVRSSLVHGTRAASGVCVGIALANAVYIGLAIGGVSLLQSMAGLYLVLKWAGCAYLAWLGWRLLHSSGEMALPEAVGGERRVGLWWVEFRTGFLSGILNPKNSLFYASLFSLGFDRETPLGVQLGYGVWMFLAVLLWDLGVARAIGYPSVVRRFRTHVRRIERLTGGILMSMALVIAGSR